MTVSFVRAVRFRIPTAAGAALCCLLSLMFYSSSSFAAERSQVLVLHSYHQGYRWTDEVQRGIDSVLQPDQHNIDLHIHYMGTKRISTGTHYQRLLDLYTQQFTGQRFDLIIASDDNAFNFLIAHRDRLFPNTPVIFTGVNNLDPQRLQGLKGFTGVNEEADFAAGIAFALSMHPKTQHLLLITDTTTTGQKVRVSLESVLATLPKPLNAEIVDDISIEELLDKVRALPPNSLIYLTLFIRDRNNRFVEYNQIPQMLSAATDVPIYAAWDFNLGQGIIGGLLTSGLYQGKAAALLAQRVLAGEPVDTIPPVMKSPNRYMVDYAQLKRHGLSTNQLPEGTILINQPDSFYERFKIQLWFIGLLFLFLFLAIALQRAHIQRQQKTKAELQRSQQTLQALFDHSFQFFGLLTPEGLLTKVNRTALKLLDKPERCVLNQPFWETPWWRHSRKEQQRLREHIEAAATGRLVRFDTTLQKRDGEEILVDFTISPIKDSDGHVVLLIPEGRDITQLKETQQALTQLNQELEQRVYWRTLALENSNRDLKRAMEDLQQAQEQLIEAEKLASLGNLVSGVAHEINTPLGIGVTAATHIQEMVQEAYQRYTQGELKRSEFEEFQRTLNESAQILVSNLSRASELVRSFKLVSSDQSSDERRQFKCRTYIEDVLLTLKPRLKRGNYRTSLECPEELMIDSYPGLFSQILTNLIINSLDHGFEGRSEGNIWISLREENQQLLLTYKDDGCGMSAEGLKRLFEPFYTTKRGLGGTGLGAYIIYNITTHALKGSIQSFSEPGEGLTYEIRIPLSLEQAQAS